MSKRATTDHGEIIHFAGAHKLFPVQAANGEVRLASRDDVAAGETRVGWPVYFRPFIDRQLVFLYDETGGQAVSREAAGEALAHAPAGPAGAASTSA